MLHIIYILCWRKQIKVKSFLPISRNKSNIYAMQPQDTMSTIRHFCMICLLLLIGTGDSFAPRSLSNRMCSPYSLLHKRSKLFFGFPGFSKDDKGKLSNEQTGDEEKVLAENKKIRLSGLIQLITAGTTVSLFSTSSVLTSFKNICY